MRDRNDWLIIGVLAAIGLLVMVSAAKAEHDYNLNTPINGQMFTCDTAEQILDVANTHKEKGFEAAKEVAKRYMGTLNALGEPTCAAWNFRGLVPVEVVAVVRGLEFPSGTADVSVIRVHYIDSDKEFFVASSKKFGEQHAEERGA